MLIKLGAIYVNASAIRAIRRAGPADGGRSRFEVEYEGGDTDVFEAEGDFSVASPLFPDVAGHTVLTVDPSGAVREAALLAFETGTRDASFLPVLITSAGRQLIGPRVGLCGPSGRVATAGAVFPTRAAFVAHCLAGEPP